jgi:hypothetical protein
LTAYSQSQRVGIGPIPPAVARDFRPPGHLLASASLVATAKKSDDSFRMGLTNTLEARFPISSTYALLMTWRDKPDTDSAVVEGDKEAAANLNALTVAEAEHQWFHLPSTTPPQAVGQLLPLSPRLLPSYDADVALRSSGATRHIKGSSRNSVATS